MPPEGPDVAHVVVSSASRFAPSSHRPVRVVGVVSRAASLTRLVPSSRPYRLRLVSRLVCVVLPVPSERVCGLCLSACCRTAEPKQMAFP